MFSKIGCRAICILVFAGLSQAWLVSKLKTPEKEQLAVSGASDECVAKALAGDCSFYTCYDQRFPCERDNYALSYGLHFCSKFEDHMEDFSTEAQNWINSTKLCIMQNMLQSYHQNRLNCRAHIHAMEHAYADCSQQHGICEPPMLYNNREAFRSVYMENTSARAMKRILMTLKKCSVWSVMQFFSWIDRKMDFDFDFDVEDFNIDLDFLRPN